MGVDGRGIRAETEHLAGAIAAQAPDGGRDLAVRLSRQAVKITFSLGVGEGTSFEIPLAHIVPGDVLIGAHGVTVDRLGGGLRGGGFGFLGEGGHGGEQAGVEEGA